MSSESRTIAIGATPPRRSSDIARGVRGWLLWLPPIAVLGVASYLGSSGAISREWEGILLVLGTACFGGLCLTNALRCGRLHCWIDGTALPVLAGAGVLILAGSVSLGWSTFLSLLWGIVLLCFVAECLLGPYWTRNTA